LILTWLLMVSCSPQPTRLRITSGCAKEPMWIAHEAGSGVGPDAQNIKIEPLQSYDFQVYDNLKATRYWPKYRCDSSGNGCELGGSGGPGQICDKMVGCSPAIDSKFEATFGEAGKPCNTTWPPGEYAGCDWLDISFVDGFTVPFKLNIKGDCQSLRVNTSGHKIIDCSHLSTDSCPTTENLGAAGKNVSLQAVHPALGKVVGCYSPCSKLTFRNWNNPIAKDHTPEDSVAKDYCCPTPPESPEQCRTGPVGKTEFVQAVHKMCPGVYGYAYDDGVGLLTCPAGTTYEMIFYCPSTPPSPPGPKPYPKCSVGDTVSCPGSNTQQCAGNSCCPDGSICPSASHAFTGCPKKKEKDCTDGPSPAPSPPTPPTPPGPPSPPQPPSPPSPASCNVGDTVTCPGAGITKCAGNSCCPDGSSCPSASHDFDGCPKGKEKDCTKPVLVV